MFPVKLSENPNAGSVQKENLVGAIGLEPTTPTMSTKYPGHLRSQDETW
jgi:hypothetical protein